MNQQFKKVILQSTNSESITKTEVIQELWSGYGRILRLQLNKGDHKSVVVKHIQLEEKGAHPRGWNSDLSHQRKLHSYEVETQWYKDYAQQCPSLARIPQCLGMDKKDGEVLIILEDLNSSGYPSRKTAVTWKDIENCLHWLANFHATFMGNNPKGLWETGTYWHLETRPEELAALDDLPLKKVAERIDQILKESPFQTIVHGDAKLANFCFSEDGEKVSAVDFQYVGGGCGMKDVAYFVGSCLYEEDCERYEERILDSYFQELRSALQRQRKNVDLDALEKNWRALYPVAWTDFHRFLKGWSPDHWKINAYSERVKREVLKAVSSEQ
ncbi:oxidoreductase family protein [Algivirga pacifica]|uniref:DUF1679 domain-containing protein n=1 Tax=Algivirga pacifica TaxID=1162670 RepID=A0ABP9D762_9BACT